jgi:hypothetical protein
MPINIEGIIERAFEQAFSKALGRVDEFSTDYQC